MTSDYKICINCVGKKIQNMIPIHIYKCTPRISIGIDKKIQDVILFSMISVHFFEGSQKIALFYLFLQGGIGGAKLGGGPILRSAITPLLPNASFSLPPEFS